MNIQVVRSTKQKTRVPVPTSTPAQAAAPITARTHPQVSPGDDLHILIAKRAYELHSERRYRQGNALDDWLEAEREILSQIPPA